MAIRKAGANDFASDDVAKPTAEIGEATQPSDVLATLVRIEGARETTVHPILADTFLIGRVAECNLRIVGDNKVSRVHARILRHSFHFMIEDMKSANGVQINGKPLTGPTELKVGDRVQIGNHVYRFKRRATD